MKTPAASRHAPEPSYGSFWRSTLARGALILHAESTMEKPIIKSLKVGG